jgi:hypothetical protein
MPKINASNPKGCHKLMLLIQVVRDGQAKRMIVQSGELHFYKQLFKLKFNLQSEA